MCMDVILVSGMLEGRRISFSEFEKVIFCCAADFEIMSIYICCVRF